MSGKQDLVNDENVVTIEIYKRIRLLCVCFLSMHENNILDLLHKILKPSLLSKYHIYFTFNPLVYWLC